MPEFYDWVDTEECSKGRNFTREMVGHKDLDDR